MEPVESDQSRPKVVFVVPWLRHYNARFLGILRDLMDDRGVTMDVVYGQPAGSDAGRGDTVAPPWGISVDHREVGFGRRRFTWQPYVDVLRTADLVVAQQASKLLLNYVMLARQAVGGPRVAFWGHGRNFQATSSFQRAAEQGKRLMTRRSHWFFAYTDLSARVLIDNGYPADRITVVENSVDTRSLSEARDRVTEEDVSSLKASLGLEGENVGIFCGGMYAEKRLDFLLEAAVEVRSRVPDFELICIGDGAERHLVDDAATEHRWIHAVGPQFGDGLARHFALASVFMLPYLVGLTILDSFVFETPMITTSGAGHGPEIQYLEDGVNGMIVDEGRPSEYADVVANVLTDLELRESLVDGCVASAGEHTMEEMAERFASGLMLALRSR